METIFYYIEDKGFSTSLHVGKLDFFGTGKTLAAAVKDLYKGVALFKKSCKKSGETYPAVLDAVQTLECKESVESFLNRYSDVLVARGIAERAGINNTQLWKYQNQGVQPRNKQLEKLQTAINALGRELSVVRF